MILAIRFSHDYPKLQSLTHATLLQIFVICFEQLTDAFKDFDTLQVSGMHYDFNLKPNALVMVLIFGDRATGRSFTTVRRWTQEKYNYYKANVGQDFEIVRGDGA